MSQTKRALATAVCVDNRLHEELRASRREIREWKYLLWLAIRAAGGEVAISDRLAMSTTPIDSHWEIQSIQDPMTRDTILRAVDNRCQSGA